MSLFSNKTKTINTNQNTNNIIHRNPYFSFTLRAPPANLSTNNGQNTQNSQNAQRNASEPKKMRWGEPTWFLFHTLAHKIKDENFLQIKNDFLNICFTICRNLPCPTCADHATRFMQNVNFNAIHNKQQIKDLFFEFHNSVNKEKGFELFNKNNLDEKYSRANTVAIIRNFIFHFRDKSRSIRNIANDFFRERTIVEINNWFSKNLQYFSS